MNKDYSPGGGGWRKGQLGFSCPPFWAQWLRRGSPPGLAAFTGSGPSTVASPGTTPHVTPSGTLPGDGPCTLRGLCPGAPAPRT